MSSPDVAIVGGGVIGLAVGWRLASAGMRVAVFERERVGGQASGAAAGLLAPVSEHLTPDEFLAYGIASLRAYPAFVEALREESGVDPELVAGGVLRVALTAEEAETLHRLPTGDLSAEILDSRQVLELEPAVAAAAVGGLLVHEESHVSSPRLVAALAAAARRRGALIHEGVPVSQFIWQGDRVVGIETPQGQVAAGEVVVAAGAWSGLLARLTLPVTPIRGQIVSLDVGALMLSRPLFGVGAYLVPKRDGTIAVGATEDRAGFAATPTARGVRAVLTGAERLVPAVADCAFLRAWAGLRPATPDRLPILGRMTEGLILATGHYRNGILLAPMTAECVAALILSGEPPLPLDLYAPGRFAPVEP
ncbi:MAG: glycine oxidase ThiO [Chloroflexota bacterium]|nr:glycine oxidase ThiO [Dehalococcoidia bacterium]MDW8254279.1 glycine oxidase ThiO [Chloroflexota bacterium]